LRNEKVSWSASSCSAATAAAAAAAAAADDDDDDGDDDDDDDDVGCAHCLSGRARALRLDRGNCDRRRRFGGEASCSPPKALWSRAARARRFIVVPPARKTNFL
jgi:hypothetical protein